MRNIGSGKDGYPVDQGQRMPNAIRKPGFHGKLGEPRSSTPTIGFGRCGFAGTSTSMIANQAESASRMASRPVREQAVPFLACHEVLNDRIRETFRNAALPRQSL